MVSKLGHCHFQQYRGPWREIKVYFLQRLIVYLPKCRKQKFDVSEQKERKKESPTQTRVSNTPRSKDGKSDVTQVKDPGGLPGTVPMLACSAQ